MQLFQTVVHNDKANILNSISTNKYSESFNLWPLKLTRIAGFQCHAIQNKSKSKSKLFNR